MFLLIAPILYLPVIIPLLPSLVHGYDMWRCSKYQQTLRTAACKLVGGTANHNTKIDALKLTILTGWDSVTFMLYYAVLNALGSISVQPVPQKPELGVVKPRTAN